MSTTLSAPALELLHRAQGTRADVQNRQALEGEAGANRLSDEQVRSLSTTLEGFTAATEVAEEQLRNRPEVASNYVDLEATLQKLEQARLLVQSILDQRRVDATLQALQLADACALSGYARALRNDVAADGRRVDDGSQPSPPRAPPIVVLEPSPGPAMTPPRTSVFAPGFLRATKVPVTIPLVYVPPSYLRSLGQLTTLQHEIGHLCDHHNGLTNAFTAALPALIPGNEWPGPGERRVRWAAWMEEVVADVTGLVLAGPAFGMTLSAILSGRGDAAAQWSLARNGGYPPPLLRLHLLRCTLEALGMDAAFLGPEGAPPGAAPYFADARAIVEAMLGQQFASLPGGCLRALADTKAEHELAGELAAALADGTAVNGLTPVRLLPSAVQLATADAPEKLAAIHAAALKQSSRLATPSWVLSDRELRDLKELTKVQPTLLDDSDERVKSPPLKLLTEHDYIAFVGATHWKLEARLKEARSKRDKPWSSLELFFLAPARLGAFASNLYSEATLIDRNHQARVALEGLLAAEGSAFAAAWKLYEYDQPDFFASYWDWDEPQGRIHISPAVWGLDLSVCPGHDLLRGATPSYAYSAYAEGLGHLRSQSRLIAASSQIR